MSFDEQARQSPGGHGPPMRTNAFFGDPTPKPCRGEAKAHNLSVVPLGARENAQTSLGVPAAGNRPQLPILLVKTRQAAFFGYSCQRASRCGEGAGRQESGKRVLLFPQTDSTFILQDSTGSQPKPTPPPRRAAPHGPAKLTAISPGQKGPIEEVIREMECPKARKGHAPYGRVCRKRGPCLGNSAKAGRPCRGPQPNARRWGPIEGRAAPSSSPPGPTKKAIFAVATEPPCRRKGVIGRPWILSIQGPMGPGDRMGLLQ
jgi:hypothetical protein